MNRQRPKIDDEPEVGKERHNRYAAAIDKCNAAMQAGFYVESIAIIESLIGDRLESISNQISGGGQDYKTVSKLIEYLKGKNANSLLNPDILSTLELISDWFKKRSFAVHELAKLTPDIKESFSDSYNKLPNIAEEGLSLFRQIDNQIRKYRKTNH